jgi:cytochrome c biogenesis protein
MKLLKIQKSFKIFTDLKFAIFILMFLAFASSLGSFIEQDESILFYQENYSKPIYGFIDSNFILNLGFDHVYTTWWFLSLLIILAICLISCTITRQFPIFKNSKEYFFKKKKNSVVTLPFSIKIKTIYYLKELILLKIQNLNFYLYQNGNIVYGYKGLIGRISPILVHLSLIIILAGAGIGAFKNFKAQEVLPKGEIFHIQNPLRVGWLTSLPTATTRINDFWVEYENNRIHQFYSNLSILDNYGNEIKTQTISVNNPLRYQNIDYYQSDWNLLGIRLKNVETNQIYEFPLFSLPKTSKAWLTWINQGTGINEVNFPEKDINENKLLVFDQFENSFLTYDQDGNFLSKNTLGDSITKKLIILDILPSTGLLIKYDPSIFIIYFGFGLLMITSSLSYLPYTQIWLFTQKKYSWVGSITNRGQIQLELDFENLIRNIENDLSIKK